MNERNENTVLETLELDTEEIVDTFINRKWYEDLCEEETETVI